MLRPAEPIPDLPEARNSRTSFWKFHVARRPIGLAARLHATHHRGRCRRTTGMPRAKRLAAAVYSVDSTDESDSRKRTVAAAERVLAIGGMLARNNLP